MKNIMIFPPYWCASHPYLSMPCLSAYLKEKEVEIRQIDLNIECIDYFLSIEFLNICKEKIKLTSSISDIDERIFMKDMMLSCFRKQNNKNKSLKPLKQKVLGILILLKYVVINQRFLTIPKIFFISPRVMIFCPMFRSKTSFMSSVTSSA